MGAVRIARWSLGKTVKVLASIEETCAIRYVEMGSILSTSAMMEI
jgi:hypothetical protein